MVRVAVLSACALLVVLKASAACNYLSDRSVVFADNTKPICEETSDSVSELKTKTLNWATSKIDVKESKKNYWEQWAFKNNQTSILTSKVEKNHFGLGVWMPKELMEEESKMDTEVLLLSHGLMFSVGFGNKGDGQPRMRLDYRWHDYVDADWMMQIEVPF